MPTGSMEKRKKAKISKCYKDLERPYEKNDVRLNVVWTSEKTDNK